MSFKWKFIYSLGVMGLLSIVSFVVHAQGVTSTTATAAVSLDQLVGNAQNVYTAFKTLGILAGVSALINLVVNVSKLSPINEFIVNNNLKWIRPVLALLLGFVSGLGVALGNNMSTLSAVIYAVVGLFSGGGAIAIHELISVFKGARK